MAPVVFKDFDESPERVKCFMGCGVLGGREYMARGVERGPDSSFWHLENSAHALKVSIIERFWVRVTVQIMQPDPER